MKHKLTIVRAFKWLFISFLVVFFIGSFTFSLVKAKWAISDALTHAKSIRLEHYRNAIDNFGTEQIIASKNLAPEDFHRVGDAFPIFLDIGIPSVLGELKCMFVPHHRIIITDASGNITTIKVCFECDHFNITHGDQSYENIQGTPFIWQKTLRIFFAEEGMPNSPELYQGSFSQGAETNQTPAVNK